MYRTILNFSIMDCTKLKLYHRQITLIKILGIIAVIAALAVLLPVFRKDATVTTEIHFYSQTINPVEITNLTDVAPLVIVQNGQSAVTVIIPQHGSPLSAQQPDGETVERLAANEFVAHVKQATGVELPIVTDDQAPDNRPLLLIGARNLAERGGMHIGELKREGFRVGFTRDGHGAIIGHVPPANEPWCTPRGTLNGVYDVLERFLGVRWYYPGADGCVIPKTSKFVLPAVSYTDAPYRIKRTMWPWFAFSTGEKLPGMDRLSCDLHKYRSRE
ncbi:MAG: hypothetical protein JW808_03180, partial [Victivallales bacterium]|nr:hypothetical protein [Victivallales bacterium]